MAVSIVSFILFFLILATFLDIKNTLLLLPHNLNNLFLLWFCDS